MNYDVFILRRAQRELARLEASSYRRLKSAIIRLGEDPRPRGSRKLRGREGWRIRSGEYRTIYQIDDTARTVTVIHVGHRRDVYL